MNTLFLTFLVAKLEDFPHIYMYEYIISYMYIYNICILLHIYDIYPDVIIGAQKLNNGDTSLYQNFLPPSPQLLSFDPLETRERAHNFSYPFIKST